MDAVLVAFLVAVAGAINPTIQFLYQRKLNTTPAHERLIDLLQQTIEAQGQRITTLEGELSLVRQEISGLRSENTDLRRTVTAQAVELAKREVK